MAFNIALSGLNAASKDLEVTANNIANTVGSGVKLANIAQMFAAGNPETTGNSFDFAISGDGFFTMRDGKGYSYTRAGAFHPDASGYVINNSGQHLQVFAPTANGFDTSRLTDLQLTDAQSAAKATASVAMTLNLPSDATAPTTTPFSPADALSYNQAAPFSAYDSLGATHNGTVYFVKGAAPNTWSAHLYVDGVSAGAPQTLSFTSSGALATPAGGKLNFGALSVSPGADPMALSIDLGKATQFGNTYSLNAVDPDGYPTGTLSGIDVSSEGVVQAKYSNGEAVALGQVALADFSNLQGLRQLDSTSWAASFDSGTPIMGAAGQGTFGQVHSGVLEASNTADLTAQLVNMIKAQRNYQANAQVISTDDKLTQTIINIRN